MMNTLVKQTFAPRFYVLLIIKMLMMMMMMMMQMDMLKMKMVRISNLLIHLREQVLLVFKLPQHSLKSIGISIRRKTHQH